MKTLLVKNETKKRYWLSYDLGLGGNYEEMYQWLDGYGAKECGDSMATFSTAQTVDQLTKEIKRVVGARGRVYLISAGSGGKFILGKRKPAAWAGYAMSEESDLEV